MVSETNLEPSVSFQSPVDTPPELTSRTGTAPSDRPTSDPLQQNASSPATGHPPKMKTRRRVPVFLRKLFPWKSRNRPPETQQSTSNSVRGHRRTTSSTSTGSFRLQRRVLVPNHTVPDNVPPKSHPNAGYAGNRIRTTKYTPLTFVPKNLFEQFHRFANLYFLFIVFLNWVPHISAFGKEVAMVPVLFVLGVTAVKDAFEDRRRYRSDKRVNNSTCRVYSKAADRYVKKLWKEVSVGDIVHLSCNEMIPADILLLRSSDEQGLCYIESANLDGESNLKQREVIRGAMSMQRDDFQPSNFTSTVEYDVPNNMIYRFHGLIYDERAPFVKVPVTTDNLLLRDCILKNTDFIEGIVVYAGHETKAMLNNGGPRHKRSKLERFMNRDVVFCIIILLALCLFGAVGNGVWLGSWDKNSTIPFIPMEESFWNLPALQGFVNFWTFLIILQVMIPLSLYVTIELIKLGQVFHMHEDSELYDARSKKRVECRALNIPEELGQVQYIFSDKTGTLTENLMVFRRCTIGGVDYNHGFGNVKKVKRSEPNSALDSSIDSNSSDVNSVTSNHERPMIINPHLKDTLTGMDMQLNESVAGDLNAQVHLSQECQRIQDFFLLMAVCNTVVVSKHPHQDKMNSSGFILNNGNTSLASNPGSFASMNMAMSNVSTPQDRYAKLTNSETPNSSAASTPTRRPNRLPVPLLGGNRTMTPSPTPPSPKEIRPFYEGESPDEIALVEAAFKYGCRLLKRTLDSILVDLPGEGLIEFRVLHVLPFDAVRKRMSVILQHPYTCQRILYCKGADSTVLPLLERTHDQSIQYIISKTQHHLNNYSRIGLRILCLTKKVLPPDVYESWAAEHREVELATEEREHRLYKSACKIEKDLELIGATGIEDRLQDGVPEAIANLRAAGIAVWVLTGDKQETAINIAYSCKLFSMGMEIITLNTRSRDTAENTLRFYLEQVERELSSENPKVSFFTSVAAFVNSAIFGRPLSATNNRGSIVFNRDCSVRRNQRALVVDGRTLTFVLEKRLEKLFLKLAMNCSSVLCCRATPLQKASVVKLVKEKLKVLTLAIGDGANDVSMIQTADVGIGISGQEGMQAVMASDFAIARFKHLERLLLVHGHWCYDRLARTILYFFYKNASFIFVIFWYQFFCGFSGQVMMDQLYLMLFNVIFTSLPPLVTGIYDRDAPDYILLKEPTLYALGMHSQIYKKYSFWVNMVDALYQSIVIYFVPHLVYMDTDTGIWEFGTTIYTAINIVQILHISIETRSWTVLHFLAIVFSVGVYFGFAVVYNLLSVGSSTLQNPYYVIQHLMNTANFWLILVLVTVLACLPRLVVRSLQNNLTPSKVTSTILEYKANTNQDNAVVSVSWSRDSSLILRSSVSRSDSIEPPNSLQRSSLCIDHMASNESIITLRVPTVSPNCNITTPSLMV